jgi:putative nucleotidyltransferase with HDIG domain
MAHSQISLHGQGPHLPERNWQSSRRLRIGREEGLEIACDDPSLSWHHAEILATDQGWIVRDLGSKHGTFVNGVAVGQKAQRLQPKDVLQCGNLRLQVTEVQEATKPPRRTVQVQLSARRSWEHALETLAVQESHRLHQGKRLLTLIRAGYHLCHLQSPDELMQSILNDTVLVLDAQRGCMVLSNEITAALEVKAVVTTRSSLSTQRCFSKTLTQRSFNRGESLLCRNVNRDEELQATKSSVRQNMASIICALLRTPRNRLGVLHLDRGPLQKPFNRNDFFLADAIAANVSAGIESAQLVKQQADLFIQTVTALARAVELRDSYTGSHTQRVTDYALLLAEELHLPAEEVRWLRIGTPLHDIGKIGIEDSILRKPGLLTKAEFEQMKSHTVKGAEMVSAIPQLAPLIPIIRHHHERWDGQGYPDGLAGEQIPLLARIVAVADAFDAMSSERPYRRALSPQDAFAEILARAGTHFDPRCAQAFLRLRTRIAAALLNSR